MSRITTNPVSIPMNYARNVYLALGGTILAEPIEGNASNLTQTPVLNNQQIIYTAVYLPIAATITGVKWFQGTIGNYTANNYNGVGVYSISGGTLTLIDISTDDGNIWQTAASATVGSKAFAATHALATGVYIVAALYCSSAQTTAPRLGAFPDLTNAALVSLDFTNSNKFYATKSSQTALPTGSSQAMSGLGTGSSPIYLALY